MWPVVRHDFRCRDGCGVSPAALVEPACDPVENVQNRFATMRSGGRVGDPRGDGLRLLDLQIDQSTSAPAAEIAIAERRIRGGGELQRGGCLARPQCRARPRSVGSAQPAGGGGLRRAALVERLVVGKGGAAHGVGGCVTKQRQTRCHSSWRSAVRRHGGGRMIIGNIAGDNAASSRRALDRRDAVP